MPALKCGRLEIFCNIILAQTVWNPRKQFGLQIVKNAQYVLVLRKEEFGSKKWIVNLNVQPFYP